MKNNKGFTLIELLAVIVILAIIALIATPTILGVIEKARKGAAESSALGYLDAVEKQIALDLIETNADDKVIVTGDTITTPITVTEELTGKLNVKSGDSIKSGSIVLDTDKGSVVTGTCLVVTSSGNTYKVTYDGSKAAAVKGDSCA